MPHEFDLAGLKPDAQYAYRVRTRDAGAPSNAPFAAGPPSTLRTQRRPGSTFTFALQGDSHPERLGKMFDPDLYARTLRNVAQDAPDFYLMMGDDFSIERLIERSAVTQPAVDQIYAHQRGYLGLMARSSALFLVNGNHEQAAKYLLDGTPNNPAVCAGKARTRFFPLPAPDAFYSGNSQEVQHIGLLRDYYAWTWGDALFVVIDPYWHSDVPVDNQAGVRAPDQGNRKGGGGKAGGKAGPGKDDPNPDVKRGRDLWQITLGDAQYRWLSSTLRSSNAKFKFVFSHHVLGTGRGGVEEAGKFEWGGKDGRGVDRFFQQRPTWEQPIHDLMRDAGVTIFFQGHDHLYARQELDGVTSQSVPNPADATFTAFNRESYRSGDILPNSGHLRVTVSPTQVKVEYVRAFRPADEDESRKNQSIGHAYTLAPRPMKPVQPASSRPAGGKP